MEEKIWFVFKLGDKHHQGPHSQKEIHVLLRQGQLSESVIVWREGMKRWKNIRECPEFYPPAPPKQKNIKNALQELEPRQKNEGPESLDANMAQQTMEKSAEDEKETISHQEGYLLRMLVGLMLSLVVTLLIWPEQPFRKNFPRPHSLGPGQKAYLEQVRTFPPGKKILFRMAINEKRNLLWLAGNYKGEGKIFLTLISNKEKTLSLNDIKVTSKASFRHGYARFSRFTLLEGDWPVPGEYRAHVHLYPKNQKKRTVIWKGELIIPAKGNLSLSESLEKWKKRVRSRYITPLKSQYQYYQTFRSQLINMKEFYTKSFRSASWREFSTLFEQYYNREIGPLLQKFVLDGRQLHLSLFNSDSLNSREYEKLFQYGKRVGALASDMASLTEKKSIKESEKHHISEKFLPRLKSLIEQADLSLEELQKEIDYYQKELSQR